MTQETTQQRPHQADPTPRYQIGEVADRTGVTQRTLRFYEEKGLLPPPERMEGGFRLYSDQDIDRIEHIRKLQNLLGFTLSEIKEMVEADQLRQQIISTFSPERDLAERKERADQVIAALERQLDVVEPKLEQLKELKRDLIERLERMRARRAQFEDAIARGLSRLEDNR